MIRFKGNSKDLEEEFDTLDVRLQILIYAMGGFLQHNYSKPLTITDIFRGDVKSVHHYWRGADVRTRDLTESQGNAVAKFVNDHFIYGKLVDGKQIKFCLFDERKKKSKSWTAGHFHLQVDPSGVMEIRKIL